MEPTSSSPLEQAIAAEVRALASRKRLTYKEIQKTAGIEQRSFSRYFIQCNRAIPIDAVWRVAEALGTPAAELIATAEAAISRQEAPAVVATTTGARRIPTRARQRQP